MRYVEFDFSSGSAKAVLLYPKVFYWWPKTVFMGSATRTAGGVTIYESYTAASLNNFKTSSSGTKNYKKDHGAILPTILTNSCMKDESSDIITLDHDAKTPFMGFDEQEFGANL